MRIGNPINTCPNLSALYFEKGDYTNMTNTFENISNTFELNEQQLIEHANWQSYFTIAKSVKAKEIKQGALNAGQKAALQLMVEENPNTGVSSAALALLIFNNPLYDYTEVVKNVELKEKRIAAPKQYDNAKISKGAIFKVYPNPAHDFITLEYQLGDSYIQMWFVIQDIAGKTLMQQNLEPGDNSIMINLSDLSANNYNLALYGDGKLIEVKKITVIK